MNYYIYIGIVFVIGLGCTVFMYMKNKKQQGNFLEEHPNAARIFYAARGSITSEIITIYTVNGENPVLFTEKMKPGVYAVPGEVELNLSFTYTRPGVMYKTVSETLGPLDLAVEVEANKDYMLSYDRKKEEFIFEEKKTKN